MEFAAIFGLVTVVLTISNLVAFFVMGYDKQLAARGQRESRVSEGLLFFMAAAFGSIGVYAGMQIFRHKTRTWYFQIGIPLLALQNGAFVYLVIDLFQS